MLGIVIPTRFWLGNGKTDLPDPLFCVLPNGLGSEVGQTPTSETIGSARSLFLRGSQQPVLGSTTFLMHENLIKTK